MNTRRPKNEEEVYSDVERQWMAAARSKPKTSPAVNTLILVVVLAAICVAAYLNRTRIAAFWQQVTGKAPPLGEKRDAELVQKLGLSLRTPQLVGGGQFIGHNLG